MHVRLSDLHDDSVELLPRWLTSSATATSMKLEISNDSHVASACKILRRISDSNSNMQHLSVDGFIAAEVCAELSYLMKANSTIDSLELSGTGWYEPAGEALGEVLGGGESLIHLKICVDSLGDSTISALLNHWLRNRSRTLESLVIGGEILSDGIGKRLADLLEGDVIPLKRFEFRSEGASDEVGFAFAKMLEKNTTLNHLELWYPDLNNRAASEIVKALSKNRSLTSLDLPLDHSVSCVDANGEWDWLPNSEHVLPPLENVLRRNMTLLRVDLGDVELSPLITEALERNRDLPELRFHVALVSTLTQDDLMRAVVDAMGQQAFQRMILSFFW